MGKKTSVRGGAARPSDLTILGKRGPVSTRLRWIDRNDVRFVAESPLRAGVEYPARLKGGPDAEPVDLRVMVSSVSEASIDPSDGYLCRGMHRTIDDEDHDALLSVLPEIIAQLAESRPSIQRRAAIATRAVQREQLIRSRSNYSRDGEDDLDSQFTRRAARARASRETLARRKADRSDWGRRSIGRIPDAQLSRADRVHALLRLGNPGQVKQAVRLVDHSVWVKLATSATLRRNESVQVTIQLPDHSFVQLDAVVRHVRQRGYVVEAPTPPHHVLPVLIQAGAARD